MPKTLWPNCTLIAQLAKYILIMRFYLNCNNLFRNWQQGMENMIIRVYAIKWDHLAKASNSETVSLNDLPTTSSFTDCYRILYWWIPFKGQDSCSYSIQLKLAWAENSGMFLFWENLKTFKMLLWFIYISIQTLIFANLNLKFNVKNLAGGAFNLTTSQLILTLVNRKLFDHF